MLYHFTLYYYYIGNYRPVKLIRSKIEHILATYKAALEVVNSSGEGLEDGEYESFMNHIHKKYCKWYTALDTVLGCRPNMQAAYTNEDSNEDSDSTPSESELYETRDDSMPDCSAGPPNENGGSYANGIEIADSSDDNGNDVVAEAPEASANNMLDISDLTATTSSNSSSSSNKSKRSKNSAPQQRNTSNSQTIPQTPTKRSKLIEKSTRQIKNKKISVLQASKTRRGKKLSIADSTQSSTSNKKLDSDDHIEHMYRMHEDKMRRRDQHHNQAMKIEQKRIEMEEKKMKRDEALAELQAEKLKGEVMKGIMDYNFDVMKKRKEMKEMYPHITDAALDTMLPLRELPGRN